MPSCCSNCTRQIQASMGKTTWRNCGLTTLGAIENTQCKKRWIISHIVSVTGVAATWMPFQSRTFSPWRSALTGKSQWDSASGIKWDWMLWHGLFPESVGRSWSQWTLQRFSQCYGLLQTKAKGQAGWSGLNWKWFIHVFTTHFC